MDRRLSDHIGKRFGSLVVIARSERKIGYNSLWVCRCDCGGTTERIFTSLRRVKHAGCPECLSERISAHRKEKPPVARHGDARKGNKTRLYRIWRAMRERCGNPNNASFRWYGAKGVTVCAAWLLYENFKMWALANNYNDQSSIDRLDPEGNYEPANCAWLSLSENSKRSLLYNRQKRRAMVCVV